MVVTGISLLALAKALDFIQRRLPDDVKPAVSPTSVKAIFYSYKYKSKIIKLFSGEMFIVNQQRWVTRL